MTVTPRLSLPTLLTVYARKTACALLALIASGRVRRFSLLQLDDFDSQAAPGDAARLRLSVMK